MPKQLNLLGHRFGKLVVISEEEPKYYNKQKRTVWLCKCDCGNFTVATTAALRSGNTKSCGCLIREINAKNKAKDLTGKSFGRLFVVSKAPYDPLYKRTKWLCRCICGNTVLVSGTNLTSGKTTSCGCFRKDCTSNRHKTHGESHTRLYRVWSSMRERCNNPNHISYQLYGGRGVSVCNEWNNSYECFKEWAQRSGYDSDAPRGKCTIDRIDVNGNYEPNNCRWVDMQTQSNNRR